MTEAKPLHPLTHGSILIVGAKASNFDVEITDNVRVAIWGSDHQHWNSKDLPVNTQAVFFTRWVGHSDFANIMKEVRKKRITAFTPQGTGVIAKQVKELLGMNGVKKEKEETLVVKFPDDCMLPEATPTKTTIMTMTTDDTRMRGKLNVLKPFLDFAKNDRRNAEFLMEKANELGIKTTIRSLAAWTSTHRRKVQVTEQPKAQVDISIEVLDHAIKELKDVRDFLLATVKENASLRAKVNKLKRFLED